MEYDISLPVLPKCGDLGLNAALGGPKSAGCGSYL